MKLQSLIIPLAFILGITGCSVKPQPPEDKTAQWEQIKRLDYLGSESVVVYNKIPEDAEKLMHREPTAGTLPETELQVQVGELALAAKTGARTLPMAASWNTGANVAVAPMGPDYMISLVQQGYHVLPAWHLESYWTAPQLGDDYYSTSITTAAQLGLPVVLTVDSLEGSLLGDVSLQTNDKSDPRVTSKLKRKYKFYDQLSPFGAVSQWTLAGKNWATLQPKLKLIEDLYPNPPLVIVVAENFAPLLEWENLQNDFRYTLDLTDDGRRQLVADAWLARYHALQDAFRANLSKSDWQNNTIFVQRNGFGNQEMGMDATWLNGSTLTATSASVWPLTFDGASVDFRLDPALGISDIDTNSPHTRANNLPFMKAEQERLNPDFWFENTVDGNGILDDAVRYRGLVQFALWFNRPNVIREINVDSETLAATTAHFSEILDSVEMIHNSPELQDFWMNGTLVADPYNSTPYNVDIPSQYADEARWFMLQTDMTPVWAFALVKGTSPDRTWLVYVQSPLNDTLPTYVSIPEFKDVQLDATKNGAFYFVSESTQTTPEVTPTEPDVPVVPFDGGLVTNGDFATDSGWSKDTGWGIADGNAKVNSTGLGNEWMTQSNILTPGKKYRLHFTVSGYAGGTIGTDSWYPTYTSPGFVSGNGDYTLEFTADTTSLKLMATSDTVLSLDDVSVVELPDVFDGGLVTNGDFTTDSGWTKDAGWSIAEGSAKVDSTGLGNEWMTQSSVLSVGKTYQLKFTVSGYTSGTIGTDSWYPTYVNPGFVSGNGDYTLEFTADTTSLKLMATSNTILTVDNVSVVEQTAVAAAADSIATVTTVAPTTVEKTATPYTVVPGVYGYGTQTRAAYGGSVLPVILHVDTLAAGISSTDATHGSFEWAITRAYPRVVVFDISGVINCSDYLLLTSPYVTIAGQTAPGPIVLDGEFRISTHDVLIQHFAVRNTHNIDDRDAFSITSYKGPNYNIVIDHCSASWATDENMQVWTFETDNSGIYNVTFSNVLVAEGIYGHACGFINNSRNVDMTGSILAHNNNRHPFVKVGSETAFFNNLIYDYTYRVAQVSGDYDYTNAPAKLDFRGNVALAGPETGSMINEPLVDIMSDFNNNYLQLYMADNIRGYQTYSGFDVLNSAGITGYERTATPLTLPEGMAPYPSSLTYDTVLANAGARPADRDVVDTRIIYEIKTGSGGGKLSSAPAMPYYESIKQPFVEVSNPHDMYDDYYTNLEYQLHKLSNSLIPQ